jgi:hypothetical protein
MLQKKVINFLYNLSRSQAFKKLLQKYSFDDPVEIINAYNRYHGFEVSANDFTTKDKITHPGDDAELLNRICDAYILSKQHQPDTGMYSANGLWKDILDIHYKRLVEATAKKDFDKLQEYLDNMFRTGTYGLGMSGAVPKANDSRSIELYINSYIDCMLRLALYLDIPFVRKDMDNEYFVFAEKISPSKLFRQICQAIHIEPVYPLTGNPFGLKIEGETGLNIIPIVAYRHLHTALKIKEITDSYDPARILEIGGGFGGLLYYISRLIKKPLALTSIDIPEINIISSYFLSKALPDLKINFYGESDSKNKKNGMEFYILPNWEIKKIPSDSVDVVVNTDSFPEMSQETVVEYFRKISEISRYLYSFNQDCGTHAQTRLSQLDLNSLGLKRISYSIAWMRRGYFERIYCSQRIKF